MPNKAIKLRTEIAGRRSFTSLPLCISLNFEKKTKQKNGFGRSSLDDWNWYSNPMQLWHSIILTPPGILLLRIGCSTSFFSVVHRPPIRTSDLEHILHSYFVVVVVEKGHIGCQLWRQYCVQCGKTHICVWSFYVDLVAKNKKIARNKYWFSFIVFSL